MMARSLVTVAVLLASVVTSGIASAQLTLDVQSLPKGGASSRLPDFGCAIPTDLILRVPLAPPATTLTLSVNQDTLRDREEFVYELRIQNQTDAPRRIPSSLDLSLPRQKSREEGCGLRAGSVRLSAGLAVYDTQDNLVRQLSEIRLAGTDDEPGSVMMVPPHGSVRIRSVARLDVHHSQFRNDPEEADRVVSQLRAWVRIFEGDASPVDVQSRNQPTISILLRPERLLRPF